MVKTIIWLTGETCSGKTTLASRLGERAGWTALHVGKMCREKFQEEMVESENPVAPVVTNAFVRAKINDAIRATKDGQCLVIDSFPRSEEQLVYLNEKVRELGLNAEHKVWYCYCSDKEAAARLRLREKVTGDISLEEKRKSTEPEIFSHLLNRILGFSLAPVELINTSEGMPLVNERNTFSKMFTMHKEFVDESFSKHMEDYDGLTLSEMCVKAKLFDEVSSTDQISFWLRKFLDAAIHELEEAKKEIPFKWWTVDKTDLRAVRVELVDAWHFICSAAIASGMTSKSFADIYFQKLKINVERMRSGSYSSRNKTGKDDEHIGNVE